MSSFIFAATGVGAWGICANTSNQLFFRKRRGLANAFSMSGLAVGVLFWSYVTQKCVEIYSWRGAILVMGAIKLHGVPLGMLLRNPKHKPETELEKPEEPSANPAADTVTTTFNTDQEDHHYEVDDYGSSYLDNEKDPPAKTANGSAKLKEETLKSRYKAILGDKPFVIYILATFFTFVSHYIPHTFLPLRAESLQISKHKVAFVISILGVIGGIGRVFFGWISDLPRVHRMLMYAVTSILTGVATSLSVVATTFAGVALYATIYSLLSGKKYHLSWYMMI